MPLVKPEPQSPTGLFNVNWHEPPLTDEQWRQFCNSDFPEICPIEDLDVGVNRDEERPTTLPDYVPLTDPMPLAAELEANPNGVSKDQTSLPIDDSSPSQPAPDPIMSKLDGIQEILERNESQIDGLSAHLTELYPFFDSIRTTLKALTTYVNPAWELQTPRTPVKMRLDGDSDHDRMVDDSLFVEQTDW